MMQTTTIVSDGAGLRQCLLCGVFYHATEGHTCATSNMLMAWGWECPRCHTINAPWAAQCTCKPGDEFTKRVEVSE